METVRPTSILPAIKCSNCGTEIEISSMGEHVCAHESTVGPVSRDADGAGRMELPSLKLDSLPTPMIRNQSLSPAYGHGEYVKPRTAPPRIDAAAANKPYIHRDKLTAGNHGFSASRSPMTPLTGSRPPLVPVMRSMTSPMPRMCRPPSPELSSNLDCAFPPFRTSRPTTSSSLKARSTSTSTSAQGAGHRSPRSPPLLHSEPESYCGPRSPVTTGGANVMKRMNTIRPGPFDARQRQGSNDAPSKELGTTAQQSQTQDPQGFARSKTPERETTGELEQQRPSTAGEAPLKKSSIPSFTAISPPRNREGKCVPQRPIRPEPLDGFLALLKKESEEPMEQAGPILRPEARSNTFPLSNEQDAQASSTPNFSRRPSESGSRPRRPTLTSANSSPGSLSSAASPPKSSNLSVDVPPVPLLPNLPSQTFSVHAPSDSASSTSSTRSYGGSSAKSDISPSGSASSSLSNSSALGDNLQDRVNGLIVTGLQVKSKQSQPRLRQGKESRPSSPESSGSNSPEILSGTAFLKVTQQAEFESSPAPHPVQHSSVTETLPVFPPVPKSQGRQSEAAPRSLPQLSRDAAPGATEAAGPHAFKRGMSSRPSAKRPGTATKHHCRGCSDPITGKSVKAADGRLTGRYHKHCFVCKTCRSPFATADFYVIHNDPYCEHHYHELNNSLCAKCDRGIEGPYLETQQGPKYHPRCFTCFDCSKILNDDYFEISGKVHCEEHAFTALRRQDGLGPKRNMERRTTRLMMM